MAKICPICGTTYTDSSVFCPSDGATLRGDDAGGDLVGTVIADRYLISKQLGEGGMGRVYLARHVRLPQQAAIKVMHPQMVKDQDAVARFNREAANAARIEHDRVARVFDFGDTHEGLVYLAMEYVPGKTLRSLLTESKRLPPARAANIIYQVAEGLDAAHRLTIVHRDLKPDNIMVITDENGVDRCKVVDFGIAKAGDGGGGAQTQLTRTGVLVGTPEFMSPEQVLGEPLDGRSDVYSLALVAYHAFTGALPFAANNVERSLTARLIDNPATLKAAAPDVDWPADLQAAFDRALDKEPATRTATALEFGEAIVLAVENWTGTPVLRGRTPMSSASIASSITPASMTPASSGAVASTPNVMAATASVTPRTASDAPLRAAPSRGARTGAIAVVAALVLAGVVWGVFFRGDTATATNATQVPTPAIAQADSARPRTEMPSSPAIPGPNAAQKASPADARPGDAASRLPVPPTTVSDSASTVGSAPAADAIAAKTELDSIRSALAADGSDESDARAAIPEVQRLLRRLNSATDSTWAYLTLAGAYGQAGDALSACPHLRNARRLARSEAQIRAVNAFAASLSCAP